jgi:hypothetical protein
MATYLTLHPGRRAPNSRSASVGGYDWLSASILTGLEMFALATNGMCLAAFAHSFSQVPKADLANQMRPGYFSVPDSHERNPVGCGYITPQRHECCVYIRTKPVSSPESRIISEKLGEQAKKPECCHAGKQCAA